MDICMDTREGPATTGSQSADTGVPLDRDQPPGSDCDCALVAAPPPLLTPVGSFDEQNLHALASARRLSCSSETPCISRGDTIKTMPVPHDSYCFVGDTPPAVDKRRSNSCGVSRANSSSINTVPESLEIPGNMSRGNSAISNSGSNRSRFSRRSSGVQSQPGSMHSCVSRGSSLRSVPFSLDAGTIDNPLNLVMSQQTLERCPSMDVADEDAEPSGGSTYGEGQEATISGGPDMNSSCEENSGDQGSSTSDVIMEASQACQPAGFPTGGPPPIEIAFSFDTTGSMSSCIEEVQNKVREIIQRLFMDIPSLKIAVLAHGDYCDAEHFYVTKTLDFNNDVNALDQFVSDVGGTGGGDYEECYELALRKVRQELSWTPGTQRSLVIIGDAIPHEVGTGGNDDIDWRTEVQLLKNSGVRIYAVQCLSEFNSSATPFWAEMSTSTHGKHLKLDQFSTIIDMFMAICYRERGPDFFEAYEREVRMREGKAIRGELNNMFDVLRGPIVPGAVEPVQPEPVAVPSTSAMIRPVMVNARPKKGKAAMAPKVKTTGRRITGAGVATSAAMVNRTTKTKASRPTDLGTEARREARLHAKALRVRAEQRRLRKARAKAYLRSLGEYREDVPQTRFLLNGLSWSRWYPAYLPGKAGSNPPGNVLGKGQEHPAIYEWSVQPASQCKKYVVYFAATDGIPAGKRFDSYLLREPRLRDQMQKVLVQNCSVFVRRARLPDKALKVGRRNLHTARQVRQTLRRTYRYAWAPTAPKQGPRTLYKKGIQLS